MPWISAGASIGSAVIKGALGSRSARKAQQAQQEATNRALGVNQSVYDEAKGIYQPYRDVGSNALSRLSSQADEFSSPLTSQQVMAEPGYQFGLTEGQKGIEGSAAARGGLYSGANLKALQRFGTDYATTKYDDAFNRLRTQRNDSTDRFNQLAGYGERATNQVGAAGQNYGNVATGLLTRQGNANAGAAIAKGNAWQDAFNSAASGVGSINWGGSGVGAPKPTTGDFSRMDRAQGYADGGEVKRPKEDGNFGREAIMDAIKRRWAAEKPAEKASEPAKMTGDYLRNPKSVIDRREKEAGLYADGGEVNGPGGPRDDSILARLSNGEHVMDVRTVKKIGGGSLDKGHNRLTQLRMKAR